MPLSAAGYTPRTQAEIAAEIAASLGAALGIVIDLTITEDPLCRWIQAEAALQALGDLQVAGAYVAWNPNSASGAQLDRVLAAYGTQRAGATYATTRVRLLGTPTLDLSGRVLRDPDGGLWALPGGSVIGALGNVDVTATAADSGPSSPTLGAWTLTGTAPAGFTSATALQLLTGGSDAESDPAARARLALMRGAGYGTEPGLAAGLLSVPGVDPDEFRLYNNRDNVTSIQGVPAKHVEALISGTATPTAIADALLKYAAHDAGFYGTTTATGSYTLPSGTVITKDVAYTIPTAGRAFAQVTITHTGAPVDLPDDAEDTIAQTVADYSTGLRTGDTLLESGAASLLTQALPDQSQAAAPIVLFGPSASGPWSTSYMPGYRQYPRVSNEPSAAEVGGTVSEPFAISAGWQLDLSIGGGPTQSVIFPLIAAGSAQDVVDEINAAGLTGVTASASGGTVVLTSTDAGATASIEIEGTSTAALLAALGYAAGTTYGLDTDIVSITIL